MRIAHVEKQMRWAGQPNYALGMMEALRRRGHDVTLCCQPGSAIGERAAAAGVPVRELRMDGARLFPAAARLAERLRADAFDIVHAHGARDHLLAMLAGLLARRTRVIRTKHSLTSMRGAAAYRRLTHRFMAVSRAVRDLLVAEGVPAARIDVIYGGLDPAAFAPRPADPALRASLGLAADDFVIATTGRLGSKSKGVPVLLDALSRVRAQAPTARLLLVGRVEPSLKALAESLGLGDRAVFSGFRDDIADVLACVDLYAQPSLREALSLSLAEAMALERPVVAARAGGIPELVSDGETGWLCAPGDAGALARTILEVMARPGELATVGRRARERVLALFHPDRLGLELEAMYRRALEGRP